MKEMLSKTNYRKLLVNFKKSLKNINDKMDIFEPKHPLRGCHGTDLWTKWQVSCLKWDLKDSPLCLDLTYFQPKNKTEK